MMKIAEDLGKMSGCQGLVTGESIGQVASQTMASLYCTNEVCTMPVFRPVIGFDKQEIIDISEKIAHMRHQYSHLRTAVQYSLQSTL